MSTTMKPTDILYVPRPKRLVQRAAEDGHELVLVYEDKEVTFDEPELVALGFGLMEHRSFAADAVCRWSDEHPMPWDHARQVLEALVEAGILACAEDGIVPRIAPPEFDERTTTGAPGAQPVEPEPSRTFARAPDRTAELSRLALGVAFDATLLECFVPIFRVAHAAFDRDGRQLGEASVRYDALLQPLPTSWVVCSYAGSRFHEGVMNVTALRHASKRWDETLAVVDAVRSLYVERRGVQGGSLSLLDLYACATTVLALPAWMLLRPAAPVPSGAIPSEVADAFRVVDGVRFVSEAMMQGAARLPAVRAPQSTISADLFVGYAEEHGFLFGRHGGVCAGPATMIRALANLVLTGEAPKALRSRDRDADRARVIQAIGDVDAFFEYARIGTAAYLVGNRHQWLQYELLRELEGLFESPESPGSEEAREALDRYAALYSPEPVSGRVWSEQLLEHLLPEEAIPRRAPLARSEIPESLVELLRPVVAPNRLQPIASIVNRAIRAEHAWLRRVQSLQDRIVRVLRRPPRSRDLTHRDLPAMSEWQLPLVLDVVGGAFSGRCDREQGRLRVGARAHAFAARVSSGVPS